MAAPAAPNRAGRGKRKPNHNPTRFGLSPGRTSPIQIIYIRHGRRTLGRVPFPRMKGCLMTPSPLSPALPRAWIRLMTSVAVAGVVPDRRQWQRHPALSAGKGLYHVPPSTGGGKERGRWAHGQWGGTGHLPTDRGPPWRPHHDHGSRGYTGRLLPLLPARRVLKKGVSFRRSG